MITLSEGMLISAYLASSIFGILLRLIYSLFINTLIIIRNTVTEILNVYRTKKHSRAKDIIIKDFNPNVNQAINFIFIVFWVPAIILLNFYFLDGVLRLGVPVLILLFFLASGVVFEKKLNRTVRYIIFFNCKIISFVVSIASLILFPFSRLTTRIIQEICKKTAKDSKK